MSEKKDRKSKREGALSNVCILIDDTSVAETKPLKEIVTGIQPISYEDELIQRRTEIQRDKHGDMLLFPEDDVTVYKIPRELRTEYSTVPAQAYTESNSLFVKECIKSYTQDWFVIESQYQPYSGSYHQLPSKPDVIKQLHSHTFEIDIEESEVDGAQASNLVAQKEKGIFKEGYLTKAPFHSEGNSVHGSKTYKRRWFTLKQVSSDGSYLLEYKRDEASTMAKGTLYLDSCTHITKGLKGRMHGFELHIQDKVYGLAADSSAEMNSWVGALCKATGIDIGQEKALRSFFGGRKVQAKHSNFKDSLRQSNHPLLLEFAHESDISNARKRQEKRNKLFAIYSDLGNKYDVNDTPEEDVAPFKDRLCTRIMVTCQKLQFKLAIQNEDGVNIECEPFFTTLCLFDIREGRKLTEDFVCDLNHPFLKEMLTPIGGSQKEVAPEDERIMCPKQAVFAVTSPHSDVYLIVRITKILQGSISQCAEPYIKATDSNKAALKIQRNAAASCKRLEKYMMPFAWAMRPLFKNREGEIDTTTEFSSIYKQETTKLGDDEFIKLIQDVKSDKSKQQVIPGQIKCTVNKLNVNQPNCFTSALVPVKPFSRQNEIPSSLEIQEFSAEKPDLASPFTSYLNHLYVSPISINYSNQKAFSKARNLAVKMEFKESDELIAKPLKSIYSKDGSCTMTTTLITPVLYHNTTPTFYEEAKILLPTHIHNKHHILFTFYHVSVEQPKHDSHVKKKHDVETPAGYAWMSILENGIVRADKSELAVASFLPENYLSFEKQGSSGADVKWVDGKGVPLFKVNTKLVSTVYTQDQHINNFFAHWQLSHERSGSEMETSRLLKLMHAIDVITVLRFLPVIMNQLFEVLLTVTNDNVSVNVIRTLIRMITQIHEVGKEKLLKSYVKYSFRVDENRPKSVHEELAKHLRFYLKQGSDPAIIDCILQRAWFFFDVIVKSMAQAHLSSEQREVHKNRKLFDDRDARYSTEYHSSLENLLQVFVVQLVKKRQDKFQVSKDANHSLASFIKKCFTHMDRGFVFQMVNYVKDQFKSPDPQMFELKFEFLRAISEHEHFVALNMPLDIRALGGVHESGLNDTFCKKHFLVGLILKELASALNEGKVVRGFAIKLMRNLLVKHELDDRYQAEEKQARIAALYIPFLTTILEHALRFHKSFDRPFIDDSLLSTRQHVASPNGGRASPAPSRNSAVSGTNLHSMSNDAGNKHIAFVPFDDDEKRELLLCMVFILKKLSPGMVVDWWRDLLTTALKRPHWTPTALYYVHDKSFAKFLAVIDFFDILECCLNYFGYQGKKTISDKGTSPESTKQFFENKYKTVQGLHQVFTPGHTKSASDSKIDVNGLKALARECSENDHERRILLDANFSNEVSMVILDMVELFCTHFKFHLEQDAGDNILMKKIFNVLMGFLRVHQSEYILLHVFASLRSFIHKFPSALFKGSANLCGVLCYEILKMCNSKIERVRTQACCFMYLLMRYNYEYSGTGCVRVHLQVIVAVSKLIASGMNRSAMYSSLTSVKNYAVDDKGMKSTEFPAEVRDLIKKVHTVLQATEKMKEHEDDHEVLVDLEYSLAKSYSSTPELRQTWLQSMAEIHEKNGDYSEAAMCYIHAAALVAEYLKRKGLYTDGCAAFKAISPNLVPDECAMKNDDEGNSDEIRYSKEHLINLLENGIERLKRAERYEVMGTVYKLAVPLYEEDRDFSRLALAYASLQSAYEKVVEVMASGKRLLGRFYRVAFFGRAFKDDDGKEFVYKEPKLTSLPEISERLQNKYQNKYGNVKILQDSSNVKAEELNPAVNYIQLTFVRPYFDEEELQARPTDFERENNIRRFVFETPFTLSGKAHGVLSEQHKRKTILTTSHCFPYVKKRILVVQQEMYELSPLEVAIEEMQNRLKDLDHVINLNPPDMKKLQLKLQGSVSVQVNAGPLAYATTFLSSSVVKEYPAKHIETLKTVYRDFVTFCGRALELNSALIKPDQIMYHDDLKNKYEDLQEKLTPFIGLTGSLESLSSGFRQSYADSDV